MSYSRWSQSKWYTYYECTTSDDMPKNDRVFVVCDEGRFTYGELKADLEGCLKKVSGDDELRGYMKMFMADVEHDCTITIDVEIEKAPV